MIGTIIGPPLLICDLLVYANMIESLICWPNKYDHKTEVLKTYKDVGREEQTPSSLDVRWDPVNAPMICKITV